MSAKNNFSSAEGSASSLGHTARETLHDVKHDVQTLGRQAKEMARERGGQMREAAQQVAADLKGAAREKLGEVRESAQHYYEAGRDRMRDMEKGVESRIREKPITALAIAAGLGLLVGMLWARR